MQSWRPRTNSFSYCFSICLKCCPWHEKIDARWHKIILANRSVWRSKLQSSLRKQVPWPPNISDEHVSCIGRATQKACLQILFTCPAPAIVFGNATKTNPHLLLTFDMVQDPLHLPRETTSERLKASEHVRTWCALYILTSICVSHHNCVNFSAC